jgi:Ca2+-binding RTX toxin-like protein
MRRVKAGIATAVAIGFTMSAAQAQAEQTYRFEPVDAAICKKRTAMGDKSGGKTKLAPNKKHKYNAGDGNDTLIGGKKNDILNGGRGNDKVFGGGGNDVVCGGVGNDKVFGDEGNDRVFGEEENDFLDGGEGNDKLNGQAGLDRLVGYVKKKGQITDGGRDLLDGSFEADVLVAGGFDTLIGGAENDELSSRTTTGVALMDGGIGNDTILGSEGSDKRLFGDIGDDTIRGLGGNDFLDGGGSNDQVFGGDGDDDVNGGDNEDFVAGDAGDDRCDGGEGTNDRFDRPSCEQVAGIP